MAVVIQRFEVYLVSLDPTVGSEIQKSRPCLVISPDEMNRHINTVIVAPMTTGSKAAPFRIALRFRGRSGLILLDQIRAVDKARLTGRLGAVAPKTLQATLDALRQMFSD